MMLYGSLTMGSWYLIAAITLQQADKQPENEQALGSATTAMFFLYYWCYGTSFAKVPWVYNSEVKISVSPWIKTSLTDNRSTLLAGAREALLPLPLQTGWERSLSRNSLKWVSTI